MQKPTEKMKLKQNQNKRSENKAKRNNSLKRKTFETRDWQEEATGEHKANMPK